MREHRTLLPEHQWIPRLITRQTKNRLMALWRSRSRQGITLATMGQTAVTRTILLEVLQFLMAADNA